MFIMKFQSRDNSLRILTFAFSFLLAVAPLIITAIFSPQLPDVIPIHWSNSIPDRMTHKAELLVFGIPPLLLWCSGAVILFSGRRGGSTKTAMLAKALLLTSAVVSAAFTPALLFTLYKNGIFAAKLDFSLTTNSSAVLNALLLLLGGIALCSYSWIHTDATEYSKRLRKASRRGGALLVSSALVVLAAGVIFSNSHDLTIALFVLNILVVFLLLLQFRM